MIPFVSEVQPLLPEGRRLLELLPLAGDGSARTFFRVLADGAATFVLCAGPDPAENAAYVRVGRHLAARGVRVPAVYGCDEARGYVLLEDLGDVSLLRALRETKFGSSEVRKFGSGAQGGLGSRSGGGVRESTEVGAARRPKSPALNPGTPELEAAAAVLALYEPVLDLLVRMQVAGSRGFDLALGFAPAPYGRELMVEQEGMYFAEEFARGLLGLELPGGLRRDLELLAAEASRAPAGHFLHRDFQSRNVHLTAGGPAVIDFQGARPGPLAYDAAALILDPYAAHPPGVRSALLGAYLERLREEGLQGEVERSWSALGAFRLLQALGAFAKLGGRLKKPGFLEHAGDGLELLLSQLEGTRTPALTGLVEEAREKWLSSEARTRTD